MNERQTKQRLFDIRDYSERVLKSLERLKETQKPGEQSGSGNKTAVLNAVKSQIQELLNEGYTAKQVADTISTDVFGILPKSITQLINQKQAIRKPKARRAVSTIMPEVQQSDTSPQPVTLDEWKYKGPVTEISDVE